MDRVRRARSSGSPHEDRAVRPTHHLPDPVGARGARSSCGGRPGARSSSRRRARRDPRGPRLRQRPDRSSPRRGGRGRRDAARRSGARATSRVVLEVRHRARARAAASRAVHVALRPGHRHRRRAPRPNRHGRRHGAMGRRGAGAPGRDRRRRARGRHGPPRRSRCRAVAGAVVRGPRLARPHSRSRGRRDVAPGGAVPPGSAGRIRPGGARTVRPTATSGERGAAPGVAPAPRVDDRPSLALPDVHADHRGRGPHRTDHRASRARRRSRVGPRGPGPRRRVHGVERPAVGVEARRHRPRPPGSTRYIGVSSTTRDGPRNRLVPSPTTCRTR